MNNLASLLQDQGKREEAAEPLHRRALEARERTLGAEHKGTLSSVHCLAILLKDHWQGKRQEAEPLHRRALEARERTLGAEDTLSSVHCLAAPELERVSATKKTRWAEFFEAPVKPRRG